MRRLLLLLGTMIGIAAFAALYVFMQPPSPQADPRRRVAAIATRPINIEPLRAASTTQAVNPLREGEDVAFTILDEKTATTAWTFKASRYDPQPDDSINVINPEAKFFFSDGRNVVLKGTNGRVVVPGGGRRGADMRGPATPPSRGELYNVAVSLFENDNP